MFKTSLTGLLRLVVAAAVTAGSLAPVAASGQARGVYYLDDGGELPYPKWFRTASDITGISVRVGWREIETADGEYDWSGLDARFKHARQSQKKVYLRVQPGNQTPSWVRDLEGFEGLFIENYAGNNVYVPEVWNTVYQEQWTQFVQALSDRYAGRAELTMVAITGLNALSNEMTLIHGRPGNRDKWFLAGFNNTKIRKAYRDWLFPLWQAEFPGVAKSLNFAGVTLRIDQEDWLTKSIIADGDRILDQLCLQYNGVGNWIRFNEKYIAMEILKEHRYRGSVGWQQVTGVVNTAYGFFADKPWQYRAIVDFMDEETGTDFIEIYGSDFTGGDDDLDLKAFYRQQISHADWLCRQGPN